MTLQAVFIVIFMLATTVKTETGGVTFWKKEVTLTCPGAGVWYEGENGKKIENDGNISWSFTYERHDKFRCDYTAENNNQMKYYFYVKGKACENCFELDAEFFLGIIVVDLIGTAVVMMIIYRCSKKKSSEGPAPSTKPPPRTGNRAPYGTSSDYETLNPNTRSMDTYSTVVNSGMVNRTG